MSDLTEPATKKSRLDFEGSRSFDEILELFSSEIYKGPKRLVSVKPENIEHTSHDSDNGDDEAVRNNLLSQLDSLKILFSNILSQKESDYIQLDLEHGATLEMLEEHRASNEEAKRQLEKNRREMFQSKQNISQLEKQLENVKTELDQVKSLLELKNEKLTRAEVVLKEYIPVANKNKVKICKLEKEAVVQKLEKEKLEKELKQVKLEIKDKTEKLEKQSVAELTMSMLKEKNQALIEKGDQSQTLLRENVLMKTTIRAREAEIEKLKQKAEKSKKNFFVLNNDETNDLSVELSEKVDEVKKLNEENAEMITVLNSKEREIKDMKSKIIQSESSIQKLKKEFDKSKAEFKKHFHELNRRVELHIKSKKESSFESLRKNTFHSDKSRPLSGKDSESLTTSTPMTQFPNISNFNKISSLKDFNIQSNLSPELSPITSITHPLEPSPLQSSGPLPDLVS